jgi:hypothetical protein
MLRLQTMTSTTEDQSLMQALAVLLKHENRKSILIDDEVDFSFTNERWKRTVLVKTDDGKRHTANTSKCASFQHWLLK